MLKDIRERITDRREEANVEKHLSRLWGARKTFRAREGVCTETEGFCESWWKITTSETECGKGKWGPGIQVFPMEIGSYFWFMKLAICGKKEGGLKSRKIVRRPYLGRPVASGEDWWLVLLVELWRKGVSKGSLTESERPVPLLCSSVRYWEGIWCLNLQ